MEGLSGGDRTGGGGRGKHGEERELQVCGGDRGGLRTKVLCSAGGQRAAAGEVDGAAPPGHDRQSTSPRGLHAQEERHMCCQVLTGQRMVGTWS